MKTFQSSAVLVLPGEGERLHVMGDQQTVKLDSSHTGGAFALIEQQNAPGKGMLPHFHTQEDELVCVMEGEMEFTVGTQTILAKEGATIFLPRGIPHSFKAGGRGARALVMFTPAGGEKMVRELNNLSAGMELEEMARVCRKYGVHFI